MDACWEEVVDRMLSLGLWALALSVVHSRSFFWIERTVLLVGKGGKRCNDYTLDWVSLTFFVALHGLFRKWGNAISYILHPPSPSPNSSHSTTTP